MTVLTVDDSAVEDDSVVTATIQTDSDYTVGTASSALVVVADDESRPGAPTGLTATEVHHAVKLDCTAPTENGGSPITGYDVTVNGGTTITVTGSKSTSYTDANRGDGDYSFQVRAADATVLPSSRTSRTAPVL